MKHIGLRHLRRERWLTLVVYGGLVLVLAGGLAYLGREVIKRPWTARDGMAVAAVGDVVFVVGGEESGRGLLDEILKIDVRRNTITVVSHLPTACCCTAAVPLDGAVYILGGQRQGGYCDGVFRMESDGRGNPQRIATLSSGRAHGAAVALAGRLYYVGGWDGTHRLDEIVEIDPASGGVRVVGHLPSGRQSVAAAAVGDRIVVIGGEDSDRQVLSEVVAFDPGTGVTERLPDLPAPRTRSAAVTVDDEVLILGGWSGHALDDVLRIDPASDAPAVSLEARLPVPMADGVVAVGKSVLYAFAGTDPEFERQIGVWRIDPVTWETTALRLRTPW
jgi:hypothetical protein